MLEQPTNAQARPKTWICQVCGYIHYGPEPPDECPVCGALKEDFELYEASESAPQQETAEIFKIFIVGAGIAGVSAAEAARKTAPNAEIVLISNETELPYYRLSLTRYLAGEVASNQLDIHPKSWYTEQKIQLMTGVVVQAVDTKKKLLTLQDGQHISYDRLILTVGARSFIPPISGSTLKNVFTLRTRRDADIILEACQGKTKCVCIGGGLLGLETAGGLARCGLDVTVLENQNWLLPRQLNETGGKVFRELLKSIGITLRAKSQTRELLGVQAVTGVLLDDDSIFPADMVVISAGVRSNLDLARQAGLNINQGILVDDAMRTSTPDVFAAGDTVEHRGVLYGTWAPAQLQGSVAGINAAGQPAEFTGLPRSNTLKVLGINLFSIGRIVSETGDRVVERVEDGKYFCFVFRDGVLVGSILLGDTALSAPVKKAAEEHLDWSALLQQNPGVKEVLEYLQKM